MFTIVHKKKRLNVLYNFLFYVFLLECYNVWSVAIENRIRLWKEIKGVGREEGDEPARAMDLIDCSRGQIVPNYLTEVLFRHITWNM